MLIILTQNDMLFLSLKIKIKQKPIAKTVMSRAERRLKSDLLMQKKIKQSHIFLKIHFKILLFFFFFLLYFLRSLKSGSKYSVSVPHVLVPFNSVTHRCHTVYQSKRLPLVKTQEKH